jgi:hypothetical protein
MNKMYLVLGDWSDDGHGKYKKVLVEVNKDVAEVQQAYKDSCKLTGIQFNHNEDYTGKDRGGWQKAGEYRICTEYEMSVINDTCVDILVEHGLDINTMLPNYDIKTGESYLDEEEYTALWFWFVGLSLTDLEYNEIKPKDDIPVINGYWNDVLNVQFGYGLYE